MITNSTHILLPALVLLLSQFFYKANGKRMTNFYVHMTWLPHRSPLSFYFPIVSQSVSSITYRAEERFSSVPLLLQFAYLFRSPFRQPSP